MTRELKTKIAISLLTIVALAYSLGLYTASAIIGDHVKQELRSADRVK